MVNFLQELVSKRKKFIIGSIVTFIIGIFIWPVLIAAVILGVLSIMTERQIIDSVNKYVVQNGISNKTYKLPFLRTRFTKTPIKILLKCNTDEEFKKEITEFYNQI